MKTLKYFFLLLIVFTTSCNDFEELNSNPNQPTEVAPNLLLTSILFTTNHTLHNMGRSVASPVIQHTAIVTSRNVESYFWDNVGHNYWGSFYLVLKDVENLREAGKAQGNPNYQAIALILRAWIFSILTDCWGDIPYTNAAMGLSDNNLTPEYDSQETVYEGVFADLRNANDLISPGFTIEGDVVYNGDINKWKKLANSLLIRGLMRISNKKNISADLNEVLNNPDQYPIFQSIDDNAGMKYSTEFPNQFPLHNIREGARTDFRLAKALVDNMNNYNDKRLTIIGQLAKKDNGEDSTIYIGRVPGTSTTDNSSWIGTVYFQDAITPLGIQVTQSVMMTYSELNFLLAEAAAKGIIAEDPSDYYYEGIRASFAFYELTATDDYLKQQGVAYETSNGLEQIGLQKWISLFYQGAEPWFEWRRTGYPTLSPAINNGNSDQIPVRFTYPESEINLNRQSYESAIANQGPNTFNTHVWWDK